jgi:DNA-binding NarL/FixJ family response regulator
LEPTRIVLIDMPRLLREIVREAIADEPDLEVVAEHDGVVDAHAIEREGADFVIVGSEAAAGGESVRSLVASRRRIRALEVHSDGRESVLYELRPYRIPLGEISSDTLLRTIRAVPTWAAEP